MQSQFELSLELEFASSKEANAAFLALRQEMHGSHERRSESSINRNKKIVLIHICAADKAALRASASSALKLAALVEDIFSGGI